MVDKILKNILTEDNIRDYIFDDRKKMDCITHIKISVYCIFANVVLCLNCLNRIFF